MQYPIIGAVLEASVNSSLKYDATYCCLINKIFYGNFGIYLLSKYKILP